MLLIFLLEEESMKALLDILLPKVLPESVEFQCIPHEGKQDLEKLVKGYRKVSGAKKIAHFLTIESNRSQSFLCFISGVQCLINR